LDPEFAQAYVWLAVHSSSQTFWGDLPSREAFATGDRLVKEALKLDSRLADAHNFMGVMHTIYNWDWSEGEVEFRRAIELEPRGDAMVHVNYCLCLAMHGRHDESQAEAGLAHKLDPLSPVVGAWVGVVLCHVGRYNDSVIRLAETVALDPGYWQSHYSLGYAFLYGEEFEKAVTSCQRAVDLSGGAQIAVRNLACAQYLAGKKDEGDKLYKTLLERSRSSYVHASFFAGIHWVRGEPDESLKWIKRAIEERDVWLSWHNLDPPCMRMTDPRILSLLEKAGL